MSNEAAAYRKKPKEILVLDCVYFSRERDQMQKDLNAARIEIERLNRFLASKTAKLACLSHVNEKLVEAISSLKNGVMVAP